MLQLNKVPDELQLSDIKLQNGLKVVVWCSIGLYGAINTFIKPGDLFALTSFSWITV